MAYLNVRERRIEAKIAWVGPELDAIASTFDRLGGPGSSHVDASGGDVVSLDWTAAAHPRFRDCGVKIELVGLGGQPTEERVKSIVDGVDGIVFVASPSAAATDANRALLGTLRRARAVPVVVHAPNDVVAALDAAALPHSDGAVETLELALAEVLAALEAGAPNAASTANASSDGSPPLLGALKRILIETVDRHVEALEPRFVAGRDGVYKRIEGALAKLVERASIGEKQMSALRDRLDALTAASVAKADLTAAVTRIQRMREEIGTEVVRALEGQRRADREQLTAVTTATTQAIDAATTATAHAIDGVGDRIAASTKASHKKTADVEASIETLRAETTEAFGKVDAKIEAVQATIETLIEELKKPKKGWFA